MSSDANKTVFVIAGEASGDALGASVMGAMNAQGDARFIGIGGAQMQEQGLDSLLPMEELCVMGVWEVLGHLPRLIKLIRGVAEEIEKAQPDLVLTIDLPDFNFRVAKLLKKRGIYKGKIVHYVAPTVWAWRPGRAKAVAGYLDGIMCLFPFEPEYFSKHGLKAAYTGHPVIAQRRDIGANVLRDVLEIPEGDNVLGLYLGSRQSEIDAHGKIFSEAIGDVLENRDNLHILVPTLPHLEYEVRRVIEGIDAPIYLIADGGKKWEGMAACDAALAVSGTIGLELAVMDVPHVIGYKASFMTWVILKLLVKVKFAHLANILLDRLVVPEYLQAKCNPVEISEGLNALFSEDDVSAKAQREGFSILREKLGGGNEKTPGERAAAFLREFL